eukprot:5008659-Pyramimonas_sp.AAC.1
MSEQGGEGGQGQRPDNVPDHLGAGWPMHGSVAVGLRTTPTQHMNGHSHVMQGQPRIIYRATWHVVFEACVSARRGSSW